MAGGEEEAPSKTNHSHLVCMRIVSFFSLVYYYYAEK